MSYLGMQANVFCPVTLRDKVHVDNIQFLEGIEF